MRDNNRTLDQLRPLQIKTHVNQWAEGSVEIFMGNTQLICTASVSETTPKWLHKVGQGWVTAEYGMLPRSGDVRMSRERSFKSGRSQEISRLIGRSLRASVDLSKLGERTLQVDCDVLQADGGTRTAAITGGFVALGLALNRLKDKHLLPEIPLKHYVSACSVGISNSQILLDLDCKEDQNCDTDMNFVMTDEGHFIEIQGTAEKNTFSQKQLLEMVEVAQKGCQELFKKQEEILGPFFKLKS
ncbi:MAG: ribonuclease PH [Bdellovibrionales bacterium]